MAACDQCALPARRQGQRRLPEVLPPPMKFVTPDKVRTKVPLALNALRLTPSKMPESDGLLRATRNRLPRASEAGSAIPGRLSCGGFDVRISNAVGPRHECQIANHTRNSFLLMSLVQHSQSAPPRSDANVRTETTPATHSRALAHCGWGNMVVGPPSWLPGLRQAFVRV